MVNTAKVTNTVGRGATRAGRAELHGYDATDVWTHAEKGRAEQRRRMREDPDGVMAEYREGRARQAEARSLDQWHSSTWDEHSDAVWEQGGEIAKMAEKIVSAEGGLATVGAVFGTLTAIEQMVSLPFSMIPFPALPAVRVNDYAVGLPHAHSHPPNLTPPNPVPIPFPSTGPIIPIPFISGAATVLINNMPAARCGDMGLSLVCGGFFPMYEIFLGSSSVWLEGARAARVGIDITKHCIFSTPRPSDRPVGPPIGTTVSSSPNVVIGGFPMPSLLSFAMGKAFKAAFKGLGKLKNMAKAADDVGEATGKAARNVDAAAPAFNRSKVKQFLDHLRRNKVKPSTVDQSLANYQRAVRQVEDLQKSGAVALAKNGMESAVESDLVKIAMSKEGRRLLDDIATQHRAHGKSVGIEGHPPSAFQKGGPMSNVGPHCQRFPGQGKMGPNGPGPPSSSSVRYSPGAEGGGVASKTKSSPSDAILVHELEHANANQAGANMVDEAPTTRGYPNAEEQAAVATENAYREQNGLPKRKNYGHLP